MIIAACHIVNLAANSHRETVKTIGRTIWNKLRSKKNKINKIIGTYEASLLLELLIFAEKKTLQPRQNNETCPPCPHLRKTI